MTEPREGKTRHDAAPTSRAAARAVIVPGGGQREKVMRALFVNGPLTDLDVQAILQIDGDTERPRRIELVEMGLVGDHHVGTTQRGTQAAAWYLTETGILWCRERGWGEPHG